MKKTLSISLLAIVAACAFAATGCAASSADDETGAADPAVSTEEAVTNGGPVYSCTNGICQCSGADVCGRMFLICKSHLYCNYDEAGGLRCICSTNATRTLGGRAKALLDDDAGAAEMISQ